MRPNGRAARAPTATPEEADMSDIVIEAAPPAEAKPGKKARKKGGKLKKLILLLVALIVIGGGAAGGYYAIGGFRGHADQPNPDLPQLVVKEGVSDEAAATARDRARGGHPDPRIFQSTYVPLEGNFTSNL